MTSYLHQSAARQQIQDLIAASESGRVRRQFRDARRAARAARRTVRLAGRSADNGAQNWAHQIGYAGVS